MRILFLTLQLCTYVTFYAQNKVDYWYKTEIKDYKGYLHYTVNEDSLLYKTEVDFRIKVDSSLFYHNIKINSEKDSFLTVKSFKLRGTTDNFPNPDEFTLSVNVTKDNDYLYWKANERDDVTIETMRPTVADMNLFYVITKLDYSKKGTILEFNLIEISELNYKEKHILEYKEDEMLLINNKEILTKKITHNGEGIRESTYWLDSENNLIKISIDNYKNYIKCNKEDINLQYYK